MADVGVGWVRVDSVRGVDGGLSLRVQVRSLREHYSTSQISADTGPV